MATESTANSSHKKLLVSKRVVVVLSSLVGALTISSMLLLVMDSGPLGGTPQPAFSVSSRSMREMLAPNQALQISQWGHIIIYESGDLEASAASLAEGRAKGVGTKPTNAKPSAKFHFVVDSASSKRDALDGELEVTPTWHRQEAGTPFAGWPDKSYYSNNNHKGAVGVCIAGDLSRRPYSEAQVRCLAQLVQELQERLHISNANVKFQWEIDANYLHRTEAQKAFADEFRKRFMD